MKIVTPPPATKRDDVEDHLLRSIERGENALTDLCTEQTTWSVVLAHKVRGTIARRIEDLQLILTDDVQGDMKKQRIQWTKNGELHDPDAVLLQRAADIVAQREKLRKLREKVPDHPLAGIADEISDIVQGLAIAAVPLAERRARDDIEPRLAIIAKARSDMLKLAALRDTPPMDHRPKPLHPDGIDRLAAALAGTTSTDAPSRSAPGGEGGLSFYSMAPSQNGHHHDPPVQKKPAPRARVEYRPPVHVPAPTVTPGKPLPEFLKMCRSPMGGGFDTELLESEEQAAESARRKELLDQLDRYLTEHVFVRYSPEWYHRYLTRLALPYASNRKDWIEWMDPTHPRYEQEENVAKRFPDWMNHMTMASAGLLRTALREGKQENFIRAFFLAEEHPVTEHSQRFALFIRDMLENKKQTIGVLDRWLGDRQAMDRRVNAAINPDDVA